MSDPLMSQCTDGFGTNH